MANINKMVEETASDYSNYLRQINFSKELNPICTNIDEILTRMDEFESSILIIKNIATATSVPNIAECKEGFQNYFDKIDNLQLVLNRINTDITALEQNVTKAEEELGYNNSGIKGFFKPLLVKVGKAEQSRPEANVTSAPLFQPTEVFKASDYFSVHTQEE